MVNKDEAVKPGLGIHLHAYNTYDANTYAHLKPIAEKNLPFCGRGNIKIAEKVKPLRTEYIEEITKWLETIEFKITFIGCEKYVSNTLSILSVHRQQTTHLLLEVEKDNLNYEIFTDKIEHIHSLIDVLEEKFKGTSGVEDGKIKFAFWQRDDEGCDAEITRNECPVFDEISDNYPKQISEKIKRLIDLEDPCKFGKIILWHGPAGGGKTNLVRMLGRAWYEKHGVIPEVIIDPDDLYHSPRYLTSLMLNGADQVYNKNENPPFRLIVAEDCAQLFTTEARNKTGFARLLNIADGLLGQGKRIIFLFTANEQIDEIDPAILRPGRCLQSLEIPIWSKVDAAKWLKAKGAENKIKLLREANTLAEMYAILNDSIRADDHRGAFGFQ